MKVLLVGDVVGSPGRRILKTVVARYRSEGLAHAIVVNAENAAGGNGITPELGREILDYGVDAITLGDHVWDQKGIGNWLDAEKRVVRPANLPPECPGRGCTVVRTPLGDLGVVALLGRVFMRPENGCPFHEADRLLSTVLPRNIPIVVDMHGEATSEKIAMGRHLDGRVAAVVGTHTHVQTSDARVLPGGTAYLTDLGMTGPYDSVIGREIGPVIGKFRTGIPVKFEVARGRAALEGALVDIDRENLRAKSISLIRELEESPQDSTHA